MCFIPMLYTIMYKIISIAFLSVLLWSCQNAPSEIKSVSEISSEKQIDKYEISYSTDTSYTEFINGLINVQKQIFLDHDTTTDEYTCDIDFNSYFKSFDRLNIAPNWKLESHYRHFGDAGRPLLLAFEEGDKLGDSIQKELNKSFEGKEFEGMLDYQVSKKLFAYQDSVEYLNCIQITNDKMGYFQYVIFALIGDNYCKFWHSNYGEMTIITSKKQLKELTELEDNFYYRFSSKEKNKNTEHDSVVDIGVFGNYTMDKESVLQIDPNPEVILNPEEATIKIVTLSPWAGFLERTFKVTRTFPHKLEQVKLDTIIEYNCGIIF